ncbi:hypothetical protein ACN23B_30605 (plasmid) [Anabaena sp. FACHB-709]|uniref:Uncharacterized protein n=2 Tax=Nostocaceae TaxID=1162 RepID=A0A1Z4KWV6_ANAVA|nr:MULTISPECIES: hypothetical protein [Nostocaceae]BAY73466.1 hypothetical protein NIES23_63180 [Trichormus variabilis NIES-23]MBD2174609.1 hypothetical protein [Anabaena cylindrica FACHB-318]MBD2266340.1 hypothetical protein [Anabaena sp. FACHB-709]MBD2275782.1 hypothetical protein [Nostoc sp. PCC 7120 = FACHB-418]MBD2286970.1 hypothetical protein [Anabaena cylindrica FACHB-170]
MTNNEVISDVFKNQQYMTPEQLSIAHEFQKMIENEYALCAREMKKANQAAVSKPISTNPDEKLSINYAGLEIDAIREYWFNRLVSLIQVIENRNPQLNKELANKYLNNEQ